MAHEDFGEHYEEEPLSSIGLAFARLSYRVEDLEIASQVQSLTQDITNLLDFHAGEPISPELNDYIGRLDDYLLQARDLIEDRTEKVIAEAGSRILIGHLFFSADRLAEAVSMLESAEDILIKELAVNDSAYLQSVEGEVRGLLLDVVRLQEVSDKAVKEENPPREPSLLDADEIDDYMLE